MLYTWVDLRNINKMYSSLAKVENHGPFILFSSGKQIHNHIQRSGAYESGPTF